MSELAALRAAAERQDGFEHFLHPHAAGRSVLRQRRDGVLAGVLTIQPGDPPELCLIVHPDERRRGVGRRLLERASQALRRRGATGLLLTVDERSASGLAFAAAVGAIRRFAEYRLELAGVPDDRPWPTPLAIRPAGAADAPAFAAVLAAAFRQTSEVAGHDLAAGMADRRHRYYLAELDGRPIGTIRLSHYRDEAHLTSFAVLPELQGRGLGRQILTRAVRQLSAEGWRSIFIEVETENRAALGLYRACGFREVGAYAYHRLDLVRGGGA